VAELVLVAQRREVAKEGMARECVDDFLEMPWRRRNIAVAPVWRGYSVVF
jgi:hypothetical protein